jgi:NADH dehydrogenase FAD-containing subunit
VRRRVLVAGGGPSALELVLALNELARGGLDVLLLAPGRHFTERTIVDGESHSRRLALATLARVAGVTHVRDALDRVDCAAHVVHTQDGLELPYDVLVLAVGARLVGAVPGALTYRGARDLDRLHDALAALDGGGRPQVLFAVPGGVAETRALYDLAVHTVGRIARDGARVEVAVVTPETEPLWSAGPEASAAMAEALASAGVGLHAAAVPAHVEDGHLWTHELGALPADLVVSLPLMSGPGLDGIPSDAAGFALVGDDGRVEDVQDVYAIGAMATRIPGPGGVAEQADALARLLTGSAPSPDGDGPPGRLHAVLERHGVRGTVT